MATRTQLTDAIILCGKQETDVEVFQLTEHRFPEYLVPIANTWCFIAIQKLQQNAVLLDGLLVRFDEGGTVHLYEIPQIPDEYTKLFELEKYKNELDNPNQLFDEALREGNVALLDVLLMDPRVNPSADYNWAIRAASERGNLAVVNRLLQDPRVDPSASGSDLSKYRTKAISRASEYGHVAVDSATAWRNNRLLQDLPSWHPYRGSVDPSIGRNYAIRAASGFGNLAVVDRLLQDSRVDPSDFYNDAIIIASKNSHLAVVERLLQEPIERGIDPTADSNNAIRMASHDGRLAVVDRLLQDSRVDPSDEDNYAIRMASRYGNLAVDSATAWRNNRLLQDTRVDPSDEDNEAIRMASRNGHLAVDSATAWRNKRLLQEPWDPRVNPSANYNEAIRMAYRDGCHAVVNRLLQEKCVKSGLDAKEISRLVRETFSD
jgi:hypothetical protein